MGCLKSVKFNFLDKIGFGCDTIGTRMTRIFTDLHGFFVFCCV
ncbi:MAG: hypothetical protein RLZZ628_4422, partial [Bacteroidota bacterium]